jgi:SAM-dependent methyltransferase
MDRSVYSRMAATEEAHWWFAARRRIIASLIRQCSPGTDDKEILEAGCGTGGNLEFLGQFGELSAFELDAASRQLAQEKSGIAVAEGALPDAIPFANKTFDLIFLLDVLEHVNQDCESLQSLAQRLEPDGKIVITVPAMPWMWSKHDEIHHHYRRYTRATLTKLAEQSGLKVENIGYFNCLLFPLALLRRIQSKITKSQTTDDALPPAWLNSILFNIFQLERIWVGRVGMPFGLSCFAILAKRDE